MELHQQAHGRWKCDYTLIKHPERTITLHHGDEEYSTMDLARGYASARRARRNRCWDRYEGKISHGERGRKYLTGVLKNAYYCKTTSNPPPCGPGDTQ